MTINAQPRPTTIGGLLFEPLLAGLVCGMAWGWLQALRLSRSSFHLMDLRQFADVFSYAGLIHGLLWMVHGLVFGGLAALLLLVLPRLRRSVRSGALGVGLFVAGAFTLQVWAITAEHMPLAGGIQPLWLAGMAACWLVLLVAGYAVFGLLAPTLAGRLLARAGRWAFAVALLLLIVSLGVQWVERPRLLPETAAWAEAGGAAPAPGGPNVVLVVLDTQRIDRLGCYGYERPTTPRLDRFAADAMVYDRYISTAVWTMPSHASIFTGLYPSEHGTSWNHIWLDDRFSTMAEVLGERGYQTFGLSNNIVVSPHTNLAQGFDRFGVPQAIVNARGTYLEKFLNGVLYPAGRVGTWLGRITGQDQGAKQTNRIAARWLAGRDRERPFFLFVNYLEPHDPFRPTGPHRRLFVDPADLRDSYRLNWDAIAEFAIMKSDVYSEADLAILNDTYDAETRLTDDRLGQLLEIVAAESDLDSTLVIITSDHGENLGDHHLLRHGWCVYDTLAHLPLIIRYPSRVPPGRSGEMAQTVDLLPTVLDAVDGEPPAAPAGSGRSLFSPPPAPPEDEGEPPLPELTGRAAVIEYNAPNRTHINAAQVKQLRVDRTPFESAIFGVRQGPWKYITYEDGRRELFNVEEDRGELDNLVAEYPDVADHLAVQLERWRAGLAPYQAGGDAGGLAETDEEMLSRLRELGYMQ